MTDPSPQIDRAVARRLAAASDRRRRSVERVLHDGIQQNMALLGLKLSILQKQIGTDDAQAVAMCGELRTEIQGALAELRTVAHLIFPAILENQGLAAALEHAAARVQVQADVVVTGSGTLPDDVQLAFYFCCLEAVENAAGHGGPGVHVDVRVEIDEDCAGFAVRDDGVGFDTAHPRTRSGLQHIADRMTVLGGSFEVVSTPGDGTTLRGTAPLAHA